MIDHALCVVSLQRPASFPPPAVRKRGRGRADEPRLQYTLNPHHAMNRECAHANRQTCLCRIRAWLCAGLWVGELQGEGGDGAGASSSSGHPATRCRPAACQHQLTAQGRVEVEVGGKGTGARRGTLSVGGGAGQSTPACTDACRAMLYARAALPPSSQPLLWLPLALGPAAPAPLPPPTAAPPVAGAATVVTPDTSGALITASWRAPCRSRCSTFCGCMHTTIA